MFHGLYVFVHQFFKGYYMLINKKKQTENSPENNPCSDAVFIGWMQDNDEGAFPLYNITVKDHPSYGSTVSDNTLRVMNLRIPQTPPYNNR